MTGSKADFLENKILDHVLRNTRYTQPASVYSALYTVTPSDSTAGTEVTNASSGYTRVATTFCTAGATFQGQSVNTAAVTFATLAAAVTIAGWGLCDTSTVAAGNILFFATVPSLALHVGDRATFPAGSIVVAGGSGDAASSGNSYSTSFTTVENPLSESSNWINGGTTGLDWNNMRVATSGQCYGLQGNGSFKDGTAILTGTWAANQSATGTIFSNSPPDASFPECELRLRTSISAHSITGYEVAWSCKVGSSAYLIIVRWNGSVGDFDYLYNDTSSAYSVGTGDVVKAEIIGNTINAYKNGTLQQSVNITSIGGTVYSSGAPGIGHNSEESGGAHNNTYGFSAFSATDL